jgi:hypothetical protein
MTRFIHDQFAKEYLKLLLEPYGKVTPDRTVTSEVKRIDVFFSPLSTKNQNLEALGLLGKFAAFPALFEAFRNPATEDEMTECVSKLLLVKGELQRKAHRKTVSVETLTIPKLWIITPTAPVSLLSTFCVIQKPDWPSAVHFIPEPFRTAIVVCGSQITL